MIHIGDDLINDIFTGDMGIKEVAIGDETIYTRSGGYLYLEVVTEEENNG